MLKRYFEAKKAEKERREALDREYERISASFYAAMKNGNVVLRPDGSMSWTTEAKAR